MPSSTEKSKQLDRIENAILGNGKEGLLARTARIEENLDATTCLAKEVKESAEKSAEKTDEAIGELKMSILKLENTIRTHIGTDHLSELMKKKEFWSIIILGFITLHIIATYLPNLWNLIVMIVGLPKLVIPTS